MNRKFGMKSLGAATISAYLMFGISSGASALTFTEQPGDAGQTIGTAMTVNTLPGNLPTEINGNLTGLGNRNRADDFADLFKLVLSEGIFTASTRFPAGSLNDPQLFLFDSSGKGVFGNDDAPGSGQLRSSISGFLTAGIYYLGISGYNYDPISSGGLIFPDAPTNQQYGPTGPGGGLPLIGWQGSGVDGTYKIDLTTQPIPTPALLPGLIGMGLAALRKRKGETAEVTSEQ